ncbi:class I SAM-dependent methyltransferase [Kitasatospora nipponensis]|uniref:Class I SAM-dependent methyltransferase n=1 Tax=Kitasatospora nipponensis TaxID=258049 RepID=A0ABN1WDL4_9ACTN
MFSDAEAAELYDLLNPWDPARFPGDAFYADLLTEADSVLDVGCGTGAMLHLARRRGHTGRLMGIDPDRAALDRARHRAGVGDAGIEWVEGTAADCPPRADFELAVMTGHAFQFLVGDEELRASLAAVAAALRVGGRFAFETRHPQARAWEEWNPADAADLTGPGGRELRVWHEVESVTGGVVTFTGTTATPDGTVLRVDRARLRFLEEAALDALLHDAGFTIEARYGDWRRGPVTAASREIVTIARRR